MLLVTLVAPLGLMAQEGSENGERERAEGGSAPQNAPQMTNDKNDIFNKKEGAGTMHPPNSLFFSYLCFSRNFLSTHSASSRNIDSGNTPL